MTIEEFDHLEEEGKRVTIFDADKVSEKFLDSTKYELFAIHDFFIETKTSIRHNVNRIITLYTLNTLPDRYAR